MESVVLRKIWGPVTDLHMETMHIRIEQIMSCPFLFDAESQLWLVL